MDAGNRGEGKRSLVEDVLDDASTVAVMTRDPTVIRPTYPPHCDVLGTEKSCEVVYVKDPENFYCQLLDAVEPLESIMNRLADVYKGTARQQHNM